jgi:hypothetical protein
MQSYFVQDSVPVRLYFPYNGWESIPNDMFKSFEDSNIRHIHLGGKKFQFINGSIFSTLSKFKYMYVNLRQNLINKISMNGLQTVRELNLAQKKIVEARKTVAMQTNQVDRNGRNNRQSSKFPSLIS